MSSLNERLNFPLRLALNKICDVSMEQQLRYEKIFNGLEKPEARDSNIISISDDKDTFKRLYEKLYLPVYYFARTLVSAEDAEEIASNSFLKLWHSDLDYSIMPKVKTWLNICTRNACLDLLRHGKRDSSKLADFAYFLNIQSEGDHETQIREELIKRLYIEMEKLPRQCKRVFKLAYLERQSSRQIAGLLGISENTVTCHRVRSLKLLRLAFQDFSWMIFIVFNILSHFPGL